MAQSPNSKNQTGGKSDLKMMTRRSFESSEENMILQQRSPSGQVVGLSSSKNKLFNMNSAADGVNIQEKEIEKLQSAADANSAKMVEYRNEIERLRG